MAKTQTISDVLLYGLEEDKGYPFDEATVTMQTGMKSGSVLELSGGKYIWVVAANVANAVAVLVDERADQETELTAGDHTLKVVTRAAAVGREYLTYADAVTQGNKDTAEAALLAVGIKAQAQV